MKNKAKSAVQVGVAALVFNSAGEVFLARRGQAARNERGFWELPGGKVESQEPLLTAIQREFLEEYDFSIDIERLLGVYETTHDENGDHWISVVYIAKFASGQPRIMEPAKCLEIGWFRMEKLPQPLTPLSHNELVDYSNALVQTNS